MSVSTVLMLLKIIWALYKLKYEYYLSVYVGITLLDMAQITITKSEMYVDVFSCRRWDCIGRRNMKGIGTSPWRCLCNRYRGRRRGACAICISARIRSLRRISSSELSCETEDVYSRAGSDGNRRGGKYLRTNFLVYGLFEVLGVDYGSDFPGAVRCPVGSNNFDLRLASVHSATECHGS